MMSGRIDHNIIVTLALWAGRRIFQVKDNNEIKWWAIQDLNLSF
jgi:hypothetical protein